MPYPRVIPHSDSSGIVDEVGEGVRRGMDRATRVILGRSIVPPFRKRRRVHGGSLAAGGSNPRSRGAGTRGLCRHPGITAHRAVRVTGPIEGRTVLVQGGAGAVGACAVQLAHRAGARVIATCPLGERQGDSIASGSGKEMISNARRSRSTPGNLATAGWDFGPNSALACGGRSKLQKNRCGLGNPSNVVSHPMCVRVSGSSLMVPHLIIVGGGFGGLSAARALRGAAVRVTLIDKRYYCIFFRML